MSYDKYVIDLSNKSDIDDQHILNVITGMLRGMPEVDAAVAPIEDDMKGNLKQAMEQADPGSEEGRIITEAWNELAEHQKETGEWYD